MTLIITTVICLIAVAFLLGAICGVKAEKSEIRKMIHKGFLSLDGDLYKVSKN